MTGTRTATDTFRAARDLLLEHRDDYDTAYREFRWPDLPEFNWAVDWFDAVLATERRDQTGVVDVDRSDTRTTVRARSPLSVALVMGTDRRWRVSRLTTVTDPNCR